MATKLSLYNGALNILGERKLATLADNVESRKKLDDIYDNNFVNRVLHMGQWNFASRAVELQASTTITPGFGFQFAFAKPTDWVRTMGIWQDEFMSTPLTNVSDEARYWFCELETIYVKYVSNDSQFGGDLTLWAPNFTEMTEHYLAMKVAPRLTGLDFNSRVLKADWKIAMTDAKATDAMEDAAKFKPLGSWSRARSGFRSDDRGKRNQLIG